MSKRRHGGLPDALASGREPSVTLDAVRKWDPARDKTVQNRLEGGVTVDGMGLFRTTIEVRNWERQGPWRALPDTLVDTGSEYTWIPRPVLDELRIAPRRKQGFVVADGRRIDRDIGYALVRAGGAEAPDLIVFAEAGDMALLGAHSLEGLNLKIDPVRKALVPAGPVIAATAA